MGIQVLIERLVWRLRAVVIARRVAACLLWALGLAIIVTAVDKLVYLGIDVGLVAAALVAAAVPAGIALATWRGRVDRLRAAIEADRALGLSDRLASAVQLAQDDGPWADAVAGDADERSRGARARDVFPFVPTISARLLIPAGIVLVVVWLLPPADLFGRMAGAVERRVVRQAQAERSAAAVGAAVEQAGLGAGPAAARTAEGKLGALRITLVNIQRELAGRDIGEARRIELSKNLARLAALLAEGGAGPKLTDAIRKTGEKLAAADEGAAAALRAAQDELDRLEKALNNPDFANAYARRIAEKKRAELRSRGAADVAAARAPVPDAGADEDLVELAASAKRPPDSADGSGGIIYSPVNVRTPSAAGWRGHGDALKSANAQIESGVVPPRHARLVRDYFDAVRPARQ